ncbi:MAG: NgoBV family restriction endonuclease [Chitinophagales bacterium]
MPSKLRVSAAQIYNELVNNFDIKSKIGSVEIKLGNITARYNGKDAVGDLLQEWIRNWFDSKNYYYRTRGNTQEFPDFLLSDSDTGDFLEIKTFNADAGPAFDIANFDSYCTSLLTKPERIEADYLILSYRMINAELRIHNVWLKKVWEISSPSGPNPIKVQTKRGQIYNIRPCTWYSQRLKHVAFTNKIDFLRALADTQDMYLQCAGYRENWLYNVINKYAENTGLMLL